MTNDIATKLAELGSRQEVRLKLRPGFIDSLTKEDDWSFIIKSHAPLEAAVSHLLAHSVGRPELVDVTWATSS